MYKEALLLVALAPSQAFIVGPSCLASPRGLTPPHLRSARRSSVGSGGPVSAVSMSVGPDEHDASDGQMFPMPGVLVVALGYVLALFLSAEPVHAEGRTGEKIFSAKCAACHANGGNVLNGQKNLKSDALAKYGYDDIDKVIAIVTKGKPPMPAYGIKSKKLGLTPEEIESVAQYVLDRAEGGWQKPSAPIAAPGAE